MLSICRFYILAAAVLCIAPGAAGAGQMGDSPAAWLDQQGYSANDFALVFAWEERCQGGAGPLVHGFRLAPRAGGAAFDVYADEDGQFLFGAGLERLGIPEKNWQPRSISRPGKTARGSRKTVAETPVPTPVPRAPRGYTLPRPDHGAALAEDATGLSSPAKGVQRVGVFQDFAVPVRVEGLVASAGSWQALLDGTFVWTVELTAPGALGQRIHFAHLALPENARLIVYNSVTPNEAYGPFGARDDFWTPTCFSESVTIECRVPSRAAMDAVSLEIDRSTYRYLGFDAYAKQAGGCNNDISCFPDWIETGLAVGGIGIIGSPGELYCTGALLSDGDRTKDTPYFMTANHCVSSQNQADDLEIYWLYQTSSCNGEPPDPASVPRTTGGAVYLAGNSVDNGTDFAFLRLRNQPPASVAYLGFDIRSQATGAEVVCIHHPSGDFKRITFGNIVDFDMPLVPHARFYELLWYDGTTEPGSSGSPLLLATNQRFIGQLYGGTASCTLPDETDHYGRFNVTYPLVEQWLGQPYSIFDVNHSGAVNATDVQLVVNAALHDDVLAAADFDDSGSVDAVDIQMILTAFLEDTW